jgi:hypothetical protein
MVDTYLVLWTLAQLYQSNCLDCKWLMKELADAAADDPEWNEWPYWGLNELDKNHRLESALIILFLSSCKFCCQLLPPTLQVKHHAVWCLWQFTFWPDHEPASSLSARKSFFEIRVTTMLNFVGAVKVPIKRLRRLTALVLEYSLQHSH